MAAAAADSGGGPARIRVVGAEREPVDWLRLLHKRLHPACEVLQVALTITILAVTAAELAGQAGANGAQAQCLVGSSTAPDLCTYT